MTAIEKNIRKATWNSKILKKSKDRDIVEYGRMTERSTRPPPGSYNTASDTWIQASTNKMPGMHSGAATIVSVTS